MIRMKYRMLESVELDKNAEVGYLSKEDFCDLVERIIDDHIYDTDLSQLTLAINQRDVDDWDDIDARLMDYEVHFEKLQIEDDKDEDGDYRSYDAEVELKLFYNIGFSIITLYVDAASFSLMEDLITDVTHSLEFNVNDAYSEFEFYEGSLDEELAKPKKGEIKKDFISRFMSDDVSKKEFPDTKQRYAVGISTWERRHK